MEDNDEFVSEIYRNTKKYKETYRNAKKYKNASLEAVHTKIKRALEQFTQRLSEPLERSTKKENNKNKLIVLLW